MIGKVGDTLVIESERADATGHRGVIEVVLQEQPPPRGLRDLDATAAAIRATGAGPVSFVERLHGSRPRSFSRPRRLL